MLRARRAELGEIRKQMSGPVVTMSNVEQEIERALKYSYRNLREILTKCLSAARVLSD